MINRFNSIPKRIKKGQKGTEVDAISGASRPGLSREPKQFLNDWYSNRRDQIDNNYEAYYGSRLPDLFKSKKTISNNEYNRLINNINNTPEYTINDIDSNENLAKSLIRLGNQQVRDLNTTDPKEASNYLNILTQGFHIPSEGYIYYGDKNPTNSIRVHENTHAARPRAQEGMINRIFNESGTFSNRTRDKYYDSAKEIYSRLMEFRYNNNINPSKTYTIEDVKNIRTNPNTVDTNILNRYDDNTILKLLNDVASNGINRFNQYAKSGMKVKPRFQTGGTLKNYIKTDDYISHAKGWSWVNSLKNIGDGKNHVTFSERDDLTPLNIDKEKQYLLDWYQNEKTLERTKNLTGERIPESLRRGTFVNTNSKAYVQEKDDGELDRYGGSYFMRGVGYNPSGRNYMVFNKENSKDSGIRMHEANHAYKDFHNSLFRGLKEYRPNQGHLNWELINETGADPDYLLDPTEIHSRLMEVRQYLNKRPGELINKKELKEAIRQLDGPTHDRFIDLYDEDAFLYWLNNIASTNRKLPLNLT